MLPERVPVPLLEVGEAGLLGELAGVVVDPVPGERARPRQVEARRAVDADRHAERRPDRRALELHERWVADAPRGRDRRAPARGLHEADRRRRDVRVALELGEADGLERRLLAEAHCRRPHHRAAGVAVVDDRAALDFYPRAQTVREAEPVGRAQALEVVDHVGRRVVVVRDSHLERQLRHARHSFRRDPRDGRHRRLDAHRRPPSVPSQRYVYRVPGSTRHTSTRMRRVAAVSSSSTR